MRPPRRRIAVAVAVLAAGVLVVGGPLGGGSSQPEDLEPYPEPPEGLTDESARRVAYEYEAAYVDRRLASVDRVRSYTVGSTVAGPERSVVARNESGVIVRVRHPYGYATRSGETDGRTNVTYFVNESRIEVLERERGVYV